MEYLEIKLIIKDKIRGVRKVERVRISWIVGSEKCLKDRNRTTTFESDARPLVM